MQRLGTDDLAADPKVRDAIQRFVREAKARHGDLVERVILYGSVARGEATEGSDVDLLVVWRGREWPALKALVPITTDILLETGVDLAVHPISPKRMERIADMDTHFYRNVQREGILVGG